MLLVMNYQPLDFLKQLSNLAAMSHNARPLNLAAMSDLRSGV